PRIGEGLDIRTPHPAVTYYPHLPLLLGGDLYPYLPQLSHHGLHLFQSAPLDEDISPSETCRYHECAGLDAVGHDGIAHRLQMLHAPDGDYRRSRPLDLGPHGNKNLG